MPKIPMPPRRIANLKNALAHRSQHSSLKTLVKNSGLGWEHRRCRAGLRVRVSKRLDQAGASAIHPKKASRLKSRLAKARTSNGRRQVVRAAAKKTDAPAGNGPSDHARRGVLFGVVESGVSCSHLRPAAVIGLSFVRRGLASRKLAFLIESRPGNAVEERVPGAPGSSRSPLADSPYSSQTSFEHPVPDSPKAVKPRDPKAGVRVQRFLCCATLGPDFATSPCRDVGLRFSGGRRRECWRRPTFS